MENAAEYTRRLLHQGARAHKSLGQNFLIDDRIIREIIQASELSRTTKLVEIGPGLGVLTRELVRQVDQMWAVELDADKVGILTRELTGAPVEILHKDGLSLNLKTLWGREQGYLIGNLPYYITSPLIMHFLAQEDSLKGMTVMVQREVAERLTAAPGSKRYGVLSVAVQLAADVEKIVDVPPASFHPAPKVYSSVVKLTLRPYPGLKTDQDRLMGFVKAAFSQRRKTLVNSLSSGLGLGKEVVAEQLKAMGFEGQRRAETVSIEEFQALAEGFSSKSG